MTDDVTQDNPEFSSSDVLYPDRSEINEDSAQDVSAVQQVDKAEGLPVAHPPKLSLWERIRQIFWIDIGGVDERIRHLDAAIENAVDTPANYVLRGELYLGIREYALAQRDFQRAYELATAQFQRSDWGLMAQAMQDRALAGLQKAEKKLRANGSSTEHMI
jgi:hypothetical protein